tara:strand:+ start:201 stop:737 length:537 start_codon:yes stop_codon:yes gene_type:complete
MTEKYIILDRDGVINYESSEYIKKPNEWNPIPGSLEAIKILTENSFKIIVITNQSGINRGIISYDNFIMINLKMNEAVDKSGGEIHSLLYSPHTPFEKSSTRKPECGMFLHAAQRYNFDLSKTYAVGDSPRDIEAAISAKCKPLAVRTGNGHEIERNNLYKVRMFDDLRASVDYIISK